MIEIRWQGRRNSEDIATNRSPQVKVESPSRRRKGWLRDRQDIREAKLESKIWYLLGKPVRKPKDSR